MKNILYLLVAFGLISCGNPFDEPAFNSTGSFTRSNSYEKYSDFEARVLEMQFFEEDYVYDESSGEESEAMNFSGAHFEPLVVGNYDMFLANSDASFSFISKGQLVFNEKIQDSALIATRPAADEDKNYYFITTKGNIYSYSMQGDKRWEKAFAEYYQEFEIFTDILVNADGVYVGSSSGRFLKLSFDGKKIYDKQFKASIMKSFASDIDGNIYLALTHNTFGETDSLLMLNSEGETVFSKSIDFVRIVKGPIVAGDNIYVAGYLQSEFMEGSLVACYDKTGYEKWRQEIPVFPRQISASSKHELFVAGYNTGVGEAMSGIFSFSRDGRQNWRLYISATVSAPLLIGKSKIAVSANTPNGAALFFMNKNNGKLFFDRGLNELPSFYSTPAVLPDGSLIFSIYHKPGIIRLTDAAINKMIPW